ncbi:DUF1351 domain-containing protein [Streptococcus azizii]|uniref:Phage protein n=1 Tax=Streptococcus azizii TaxID=1579424 RepID=A0AB36JNL2_9STRE|nr:DUF1351 domain-containing protein [Streptococcus azizii]ONK25709.1 hypothetical protein BVE86_09370 [Streptococcus azizii]
MPKDVTHSNLTTIKVDFTPAVIDVDREGIEAQVVAAVAKYSNQEVTIENYKEVFEERTTYNKLKEGLETERKKIKDAINEPYKNFEKWYKDKVLKPLDRVTTDMTEGLNAIDENQRLLRVDVVRATFEDKCMVAGLEKDTFVDKYDEYSLKKYFKTGKYELKKTTLDEMDALVLAEFDALEQYKANKQAIDEQAQEYDLPVDGYIRHLEEGKSLVDVLKIMKTDRDAIALRKEQQEAQAKAEKERKAEIERLAKEQANENIKAIDAETGEIIENCQPELESGTRGADRPQTQNTALKVAKFEPSEPIKVTMLLTLHGGKPQLDQLKEYLEDNFISFETLGGI